MLCYRLYYQPLFDCPALEKAPSCFRIIKSPGSKVTAVREKHHLFPYLEQLICRLFTCFFRKRFLPPFPTLRQRSHYAREI